MATSSSTRSIHASATKRATGVTSFRRRRSSLTAACFASSRRLTKGCTSRWPMRRSPTCWSTPSSSALAGPTPCTRTFHRRTRSTAIPSACSSARRTSSSPIRIPRRSWRRLWSAPIMATGTTELTSTSNGARRGSSRLMRPRGSTMSIPGCNCRSTLPSRTIAFVTPNC